MMNGEHLVLHEHSLPPAGEWSPTGRGWVFLRVHAGEGLVMQTPTPQLLNPSDVLVCPPATACQLRASRLGELRLNLFQVHPEMLVGILSAFERQQLAASPAKQPVRCFKHDTSLARQFETLCATATPPLKRRCDMLQLAAPILSEHLPARVPEPERFPSAKDRFVELFRQLPEAELQYRKPEELAKICGCSVRHFSRLFREHFGHPLTPKRTALRIQKARQLLVESNAKIIDVALDCGFQHVSLFTATFRRHTGMTPSEYRRRKR